MSEKKRKGDLAEHLVAKCGLERGWAVLWPLGDRLGYDLAFDTSGRIVRVQVRSAWVERRGWMFDLRKGKADLYTRLDCDCIVVVALDDPDRFYVLAVEEASVFPGTARLSRIESYRDAWGSIGAATGGDLRGSTR